MGFKVTIKNNNIDLKIKINQRQMD